MLLHCLPGATLAPMFGLLVSTIWAQPPAAPPTSTPLVPASCPQSNPYATPGYVARRPPAARQDLDRSEHLRLAVEHLRAAGCPQWAQRIVDEVLIETKLEQIRQLQQEIEQLRSGADNKQLTVKLMMLELDHAKIRERGMDLDRGVSDVLEVTNKYVVVSSDGMDQLVATLREKKLAKVLAEPTLVMVSGRPASFRSGGNIPIVVSQSLGTKSMEMMSIGTQVDCTGTILDNGRIRLELRAQVREVDQQRHAETAEHEYPRLKARCVDTAVELDDRQTVVLCGLLQRCEEDAEQSPAERSLLVAISVEIGGPASVTAATDAPGSLK